MIVMVYVPANSASFIKNNSEWFISEYWEVDTKYGRVLIKKKSYSRKIRYNALNYDDYVKMRQKYEK